MALALLAPAAHAQRAGGAIASLEALTGGKEIPPGPFAPNGDSLREHFPYPARGIGPDYTANDIRFTTKGDLWYAGVLGRLEGGKLTIKALASKSAHCPGGIGCFQRLDSPGNWKLSATKTG